MALRYTRREEVANALTHGIGAVISLVGAIVLIFFASMSGSTLEVIAVTIYGTTMLFMYVSSTLVHSLKDGRLKDIFLYFDHASIYLFIAGTYTPFLLIVLQDRIGLFFFFLIWGIAILGSVLKMIFIKKFVLLSTLIYLFLGWFVLFIWKPLAMELETTGLVLLIIGGLFYTFGTIFFLWRGFPYHHAVWHLFVVIGSIFHFFAILFYVVLVG